MKLENIIKNTKHVGKTAISTILMLLVGAATALGFEYSKDKEQDKFDNIIKLFSKEDKVKDAYSVKSVDADGNTTFGKGDKILVYSKDGTEIHSAIYNGKVKIEDIIGGTLNDRDLKLASLTPEELSAVNYAPGKYLMYVTKPNKITPETAMDLYAGNRSPHEMTFEFLEINADTKQPINKHIIELDKDGKPVYVKETIGVGGNKQKKPFNFKNNRVYKTTVVNDIMPVHIDGKKQKIELDTYDYDDGKISKWHTKNRFIASSEGKDEINMKDYDGIYAVPSRGIKAGGDAFTVLKFKPYWVKENKNGEKIIIVDEEGVRDCQVDSAEYTEFMKTVRDIYAGRAGAKFSGNIETSYAPEMSSVTEDVGGLNINKENQKHNIETKLNTQFKVSGSQTVNADLEADIAYKMVKDMTVDTSGKQTVSQLTQNYLLDVFSQYVHDPTGLYAGIGASAGLTHDKETHKSVKDGIADQEYTNMGLSGGIVGTAGWNASKVDKNLAFRIDAKGRWHPIGYTGNTELSDKNDLKQWDVELQARTLGLIDKMITGNGDWTDALKGLDAYVNAKYGQRTVNNMITQNTNKIGTGLIYKAGPVDIKAGVEIGNQPEKYVTGKGSIGFNW